MAPPRRLPPAVAEWAATLALVAAATLAVAQVVLTGASPVVVAAAAVAFAYLVYRTWRDGGEFTLDALDARPLDPEAYPAVRLAVIDLCDAAGLDVPDLYVASLDAPGAVVGRDDGSGVVAFDPRLTVVMDADALRAVLAHELAHLRVGTLSMALRRYAPTVVGFGVFWTVALAGTGQTPATLGTFAFVVLAFSSGRFPTVLRYALGLFVEPLLLLVDRYAGRMTEYRVDRLAAAATSPAALTEGLCRIAAVATGVNDEDVAGPVPFNADRSLWFSLGATHPSIEDRIAYVGCPFPDWVRTDAPAAGGG